MGDSSNGEPTPWKRPNCLPMMQSLISCSTAKHQWRSYYIYGQLDPCDTERANAMTCMSLMWMKLSEAEAKWAAHEAEMNKANPKLEPVWEFRTEPPPNFPPENPDPSQVKPML